MAKLDFPDASYSPWVAPNNVIYTYIGTSPNGYWEANTANAATNLTAVFVERTGSTMTGPLISGLSGAGYGYQLNNGNTNLGGLYKDTGSSRLILGDGSSTKIDLQGSSGTATFAGNVLLSGQLNTVNGSNFAALSAVPFDSGTKIYGYFDGTSYTSSITPTGSATFAGQVRSEAENVASFVSDKTIGYHFYAADVNTVKFSVDQDGAATFANSTVGAYTYIAHKPGTDAYCLSGGSSANPGTTWWQIKPNGDFNTLGAATFAGNVGIGTASPSETLHVVGSIRAGTVNDFIYTNNLGQISSSQPLALVSNSETVFKNTSNQERARIDSSGRVGIGTTSPLAPLDAVSNSSAFGVYVRNRSNDDYGFLGFRSNNGSEDLAQIGAQRTGANAANLLFYTSGSERMRIDSSGKMLLGTTIDSGANLTVYGTSSATTYQNANTGTGNTGNGMFVGNWGSTAAYLYNYENDAIIFGTNSAERMRILSSGGLTFNGDTTQANALDDYEEGTFLPTAFGVTGTGTTTYSLQFGAYVKIGKICHVQIRLTISSMTTGDTLAIGGLPFTTMADNQRGYASIVVSYVNFLTAPAGVTQYGAYTENNATHIRLVGITPSGNLTNIATDSSFTLLLGGTYKTNA